MSTLIASKQNIFGDEIAYVESYDFSKANMSNETRLNAITLIASICYQNPKSHGSESLYNRLMAESGGLPSSSFEFVPMLFELDFISDFYYTNYRGRTYSDTPLSISNALKYGEIIEDVDDDGDTIEYLLTNFRAIVYDFENLEIDLRDHFNTEAECTIIAKHFKVFKMKVDMPTFGQAVRHRVNWQVLSRRYVSGTRVPFDFYVADKMKDIISISEAYTTNHDLLDIQVDTNEVINICLEHYNAALTAGVKPQVARGIIPQCAYTVAWCAMQPTQFDSLIKLRTDAHAQWEIQQLANAMLEITA